MIIVFIAAADSIHTVRWVNSLSDRGNQVHLVYLKNHRNPYGEINDNVILHELKFSGSKGYYLNAIELKKIIKSIQPDIINAHYASGYGTLIRFAGLKNSMLSIWGSDVYLFPYESKLKMRIIKRNLMFPKYVASTSRVMAVQANSLLRDSRDFFITPFGVETEQFDIEKKQDSQYFKIVCIKSLREVYGLDYLIKAVSILLNMVSEKKGMAEKNKIICELYGEGEQKDELEKLIKYYQLENYVTLMGRTEHDQVPRILSTADVFCCLSNSESFGVSIIEAMAAGIPVVASDAAGFTEIVDNGINGIIVPKKNPERAAEELYRLYSDAEKRYEMGKEGKAHAKKQYDWEESVLNMLKIYKKIEEEKNV